MKTRSSHRGALQLYILILVTPCTPRGSTSSLPANDLEKARDGRGMDRFGWIYLEIFVRGNFRRGEKSAFR